MIHFHSFLNNYHTIIHYMNALIVTRTHKQHLNNNNKKKKERTN